MMSVNGNTVAGMPTRAPRAAGITTRMPWEPGSWESRPWEIENRIARVDGEARRHIAMVGHDPVACIARGPS